MATADAGSEPLTRSSVREVWWHHGHPVHTKTGGERGTDTNDRTRATRRRACAATRMVPPPARAGERHLSHPPRRIRHGPDRSLSITCRRALRDLAGVGDRGDRKSTRLNSSHVKIMYAVFCLKKQKLHH